MMRLFASMSELLNLCLENLYLTLLTPIIFALGNLNFPSLVSHHWQFLQQLGSLVPTSQDDQG